MTTNTKELQEHEKENAAWIYRASTYEQMKRDLEMSKRQGTERLTMALEYLLGITK
jgi:hypothetical protein